MRRVCRCPFSFWLPWDMICFCLRLLLRWSRRVAGNTVSPSQDCTMNKPVLEIVGVSKRFGTTLANDNISLSLAKGEIIALLGENGAGKTTLMNILFGHYVPDSGRILIDG